MPQLPRVRERGGHPEDVEPELAHGAIAPGILHAEVLARNLPHRALGGVEDHVHA